ncbi:MAG TPA: ABC transporter ATP-binding protein [Acidimicrobiales bacterium]|nr:ABC transporter ATP-binding protein [Acidimicrobiales bacterium]
MSLWVMGWRLWRYRPWTAVLGTVLWVLFHATMFFTGLVLQAVFDRAGGGRSAGFDVYALIGLFVAIEVGRFLSFFGAWYSWHRSWFIMSSLLRANMLTSLLAADGRPATRLPHSPGESVTRFRDDVEDVMWFIDIHLDVAGSILFGAAALAVMARIDAVLTVVALVPLTVVAFGNRVLTGRLRSLRKAYRLATAATTSFLGDVFESALAVRVAGAERQVLTRLGSLNRRRTAAAVRDNTAREALISFNVASVDIAVGVVLLAAASGMRHGTFTVGDLVLFAAYTDGLASIPRRLGRLLAFRRHGQVAVERMGPLAGDDARLSDAVPVYLKEAPPPCAPPSGDAAFRRFEAVGVTALHPGTTRGVRHAGLVIEAGGITVVAGAVGAGKTTLIRALLGLLPMSEGHLLWNGEEVFGPAHFMRPPRVAYVPQVPRLFSESLGDNLSIGRLHGPDDVALALRTAALDEDVSAMADGLDTVLGPRGVRLSGGQLQRAATARAILTGSPLLIVDDPSSALDVHTEEAMWERLLAQPGRALLIVSNRPDIVRRADRAVLLGDGEVRVSGPGPELASLVASPVG